MRIAIARRLASFDFICFCTVVQRAAKVRARRVLNVGGEVHIGLMEEVWCGGCRGRGELYMNHLMSADQSSHLLSLLIVYYNYII